MTSHPTTAKRSATLGPAPWLTIDRAHHAVSVNGRRVRLRQKELQLLSFLADHADRCVPRDEILAAVWDDHFRTCTNTLHVHLSRLRAKLGESPDRPIFLHTCRGRGVMLAGQRAQTFSPTVELFVGRPPQLHARRAA